MDRDLWLIAVSPVIRIVKPYRNKTDKQASDLLPSLSPTLPNTGAWRAGR